MENYPLRGLFGVSSPRPNAQRSSPQPTALIENMYYDIPLGMIEKLLASPFAGDGTLNPDLHLIFVDYLSLQVFPMMLLRGRSFIYL